VARVIAGVDLGQAAVHLNVLAAGAGRILRRVAAGFGEDIAPAAASAWGQECRGRQGHPFGDSSSAARSFTIKAVN
jgi:hypothetical protein